MSNTASLSLIIVNAVIPITEIKPTWEIKGLWKQAKNWCYERRTEKRYSKYDSTSGNANHVRQGSVHFLVRGPRKLLHTTAPGSDILHNVMWFFWEMFHSSKSTIFRIFHYDEKFTKCLHRPDEMTSRAGIGPRVVLWRLLMYGFCEYLEFVSTCANWAN